MQKITPRRLHSLLALAAMPAIAAATLSQPLSQSAQAASPNSYLEQTEEQTANKQADAFYQRARSDMEGALGRVGEDYYVTYRIVERIARANGLDDRPWRIRITTEDNINAFASDLNMLTFEGGILEQLSGDRAALACVVGHEMAHHTQNHVPTRVEVQTRVTSLQEEALLEARGEVESAQRQGSVLGSIFGAISGTLGGVIARDSYVGGVIAGNVANQVLQGLNEEQTNQAIGRAEEIYEERVKALDTEFSGVLHDQESEADEVGYSYMVRAGFESEGCIRTMNVLNRTETSQLPSFSHPKPEDRLAELNALNTAAGNQGLVSQGDANISRSANPLEYGVGRDGASLRVESRFGSQDIDDGFPQ